MLGLFWGSVLAPVVLSWVVLAHSPDGGNDPSTWAWIDVVSETTMATSLIPEEAVSIRILMQERRSGS